MKVGVIIYSVEGGPESWMEEKERPVKSSVVGSEAVEIMYSPTCRFDILGA